MSSDNKPKELQSLKTYDHISQLPATSTLSAMFSVVASLYRYFLPNHRSRIHRPHAHHRYSLLQPLYFYNNNQTTTSSLTSQLTLTVTLVDTTCPNINTCTSLIFLKSYFAPYPESKNLCRILSQIWR